MNNNNYNYELLPMDEIDIEKGNMDKSYQAVVEISSTSSTSSPEICSICLDTNNEHSMKLNCGCKSKFHKSCIRDLKIHNITQCPLCKRNAFTTTSTSRSISRSTSRSTSDMDIEDSPIFIVILTLVVTFFAFTWIASIIITTITIFNPSEFKYCDDYYKKCDYYQTTGILINNTIKEKINSAFDIKYELHSSYQYTELKPMEQNKPMEQIEMILINKTCLNLEFHEYDSSEEANKVSKKSIGLMKQFYIPYDTTIDTNCRLNYKWYSPKNFTLNVTSLFNVVLGIIINITCGTFSYLETNLDNYSTSYAWNFVKYPIKTIGYLIVIIETIMWILSSCICGYYLLFV